MKKRKNPTSVTVEKGGEVKPMEMQILRQDYGWEVKFNYDSGLTGQVQVFDVANNVIDASEVASGDTVSIMLNVADWGLTEDNVRDAIEEIE